MAGAGRRGRSSGLAATTADRERFLLLSAAGMAASGTGRGGPERGEAPGGKAGPGGQAVQGLAGLGAQAVQGLAELTAVGAGTAGLKPGLVELLAGIGEFLLEGEDGSF